MEQLKKCPFCGGEVKLLAIAGEPYPPTYEVELEKITKDSDDICFVHCPTCNANWHKQVRIDSFPLDTIKAWNTRKPMARYEELERELQSLYGECDGLLEAVVDGLVKHEGVELEKPMKARLLTDEDVDKWDKLKGAMERIMERLEKVKNREANGECPIDGMCDKKPYECTSCYSNTAIEIVREEM